MNNAFALDRKRRTRRLGPDIYTDALLDIYSPKGDATMCVACKVEIAANQCVLRFDEQDGRLVYPVRWEGEGRAKGTNTAITISGRLPAQGDRRRSTGFVQIRHFSRASGSRTSTQGCGA